MNEPFNDTPIKAHELAKLLLAGPNDDVIFYDSGNSAIMVVHYCVHSSTTELECDGISDCFVLAEYPNELGLIPDDD